MAEETVSAAEAARMLDCSRTWVIKLIERGDLNGWKVGNFYVIARNSVERYKEGQSSKKA
jgi:excisionase family DNA binding protein